LRKDDGSIEVQCGTAFEPSYIYKMLNCIRSDTFKVEGRQEDAEEFLGCLLNALNDEMLEVIVSVCVCRAQVWLPLISTPNLSLSVSCFSNNCCKIKMFQNYA
jgi:hypothetical protein